MKHTVILATLISLFSAFSANGQSAGDKKPTDEQGRPHGIWLIFYEEGSPKSVIEYKNGWRNGNQLEWNNQGRLISRNQFKNDTLNDVQYVYDGNGKLQSKRSYNMGVLHGELQIFDRNGKLQEMGRYVNG